MHWFYARDILACLDLDPNHTLVAVADLCTALGLPAAREERRVKAHSVLRQGARAWPPNRTTAERRRVCACGSSWYPCG